MKGTAIAPHHWKGFCEDFSRRHRGWLVTVESESGREPSTAEATGSARGRRASDVLADKAAFAGLSVQQREGRPARVAIAVREGERVAHHVVTVPAVFRVERTEQGADRHVAIRSVSGDLLLLEFLTPHFLPGETGPPRGREVRRRRPTRWCPHKLARRPSTSRKSL